MVLVIGGAGFIGSHMVKCLREAGEAHLVFDNLEKGHLKAVEGSKLVQGDLRNPDDIRKVFAQNIIDCVMHFAAYSLVGESVKMPAEYFQNNLIGVMNLLDGMRNAGIAKMVFSSTAAVFGEPERVPIDEDHPKNPTSPYGSSKLSTEFLLDAYATAYGMHSVALRYFNAAGADPDGVIGEDHNPESHLIPAAILSAMGKTAPMSIFGTDYPTPDGTCVRDYIHVMDLADAHLLAIQHLRRGGDSRRFNLGNGLGFSVRQVLDTVEAVTGLRVPHSDGPRRAGDPATLIASSEKIRAEWGWKPRYPDLQEIVQHAWNWRRDHPNGYES